MSPYRVLIVDDEAIIRKGLVQFIDWPQAGCQVVGEAANGDDAWEFIQHFQPDIVISDIRMPGRDGLALAHQIHRLAYPIQVILLTGFADFQYAQKAIQADVVDFLLKPTQPGMVLAALAKAVKRLEHATEQRRLTSTLAAKCLENDQLRLEKSIVNLLKGATCTDPRMISLLSERYPSFYLLLLEATPYRAAEAPAPDGLPDDGRTFTNGETHEGLAQLAARAFSDWPHNQLTLSNGQLVMMANLGAYQPDHLQTIMEIGQDMVKLADAFLGLSLNIGFSHCHDNWNQIAEAYREAVDALASLGSAGQTGAIQPPRTARWQGLDLTRIHALVQDILADIREGDSRPAELQCEALFQTLKASQAPLELIQDICIQLASLCSSQLTFYNLTMNDLGPGGQHVFTRLAESTHIRALQEILQPIVALSARLLKNENRCSSSIVVKAMAFLNEHYAEPLTLRQIADAVHVSPSYLSRLFHRQTGQTIVDVCKTIRLDQACQLLRSTELKHYEIADRVGIDDPAYFSQLFRKHTGLSPSEYRQRNGSRHSAPQSSE